MFYICVYDYAILFKFVLLFYFLFDVLLFSIYYFSRDTHGRAQFAVIGTRVILQSVKMVK